MYVEIVKYLLSKKNYIKYKIDFYFKSYKFDMEYVNCIIFEM